MPMQFVKAATQRHDLSTGKTCSTTTSNSNNNKRLKLNRESFFSYFKKSNYIPFTVFPRRDGNLLIMTAMTMAWTQSPINYQRKQSDVYLPALPGDRS